LDAGFSMNKIWDDCHLECYLDKEPKKRWRCLWCNKNYGGWHATKAVIHLAKAPKMDIAPCKALIPDEEATKYRVVFDRYIQKRAVSQAQKTSITQLVDTQNEVSIALLAEQVLNKKQKSSSSIPLEVSTITQSTTTGSKEYIQLKIIGDPNPKA
jgi:hypothetical protein